MGFTRRVKRIIKGYVKSARERLDDLEAELARRELDEYLEPGRSTEVSKSASPLSHAPRTASSPRAGAPSDAMGQGDLNEMPAELSAHFRLLGLPTNATVKQVESVYQNLMQRADPARFPEGSAERQRAEEIRRKVQVAYEAILDHIDPTSARAKRINPM